MKFETVHSKTTMRRSAIPVVYSLLLNRLSFEMSFPRDLDWLLEWSNGWGGGGDSIARQVTA